jgi:hypothetical protein
VTGPAARRRRRRDAAALGAAALLLLLAGLVWSTWTGFREERRAEVLAGLPHFPSQGPGLARREPAGVRPAPVAVPAESRDRLAAFALAPAPNLAVIQVNALLNTPLFARLLACLPPGLEEALADAGELGLDLRRDVDRVALIPGGLAMSGAFGERDLARRLSRDWRGVSAGRYRGADVYSSPENGCVAQSGTLLLMGTAGGCEALVDRALDSPAPGASAEALESDLYGRTDLQALRAGAAAEVGERDLVRPVLDSLSQLTVRANVWDEVALSIDGTPAATGSGRLEALASLARLSVQTGQAQLSDDPEWSTLLEQARVAVKDGHLQLDLAIPADSLFERLQLPCPGRDGGWR